VHFSGSLPKEKKKRTGGGGGLNKACGLSPELQAIIGEAELPRTQVKFFDKVSRVFRNLLEE
jgi:chromatin remodeling complex protein RSC6